MSAPHSNGQALSRILAAMTAAQEALRPYAPGAIAVERKAFGDIVTAADRAVNVALRSSLLRVDEGWLSEESADDLSRLDLPRLWIVDPIDGTREFVEGIPEWGISVAWVEDGRPVAGGVFNPQAKQLMLGAAGSGVTLNDTAVAVTKHGLSGARILASRSEINHGAWKQFDRAPFSYAPMGSVAYKLALVACGKADATFTLVPKNEWDVAGGVALVEAAGGRVVGLDGKPIAFNRRSTLLSGLIAGSPDIVEELLRYLPRTAS